MHSISLAIKCRKHRKCFRCTASKTAVLVILAQCFFTWQRFLTYKRKLLKSAIFQMEVRSFSSWLVLITRLFYFNLGTALSSAFVHFHVWVKERILGFLRLDDASALLLTNEMEATATFLPFRWRSCWFIALNPAVASHWPPWGFLHSRLCCSTGIFGIVPRENTPPPIPFSFLHLVCLLLILSFLATVFPSMQFGYGAVPNSCLKKSILWYLSTNIFCFSLCFVVRLPTWF